jgi:5-methylthioadenosine/S-adenosylhomocysteine deaminase
MDARTLFRMATIEGAKALGMEDRIGSLEEGKKADLLLLDLNSYMNSLSEDDEKYYSDIVYSASADSVKHVMAGGEWLMKNAEISRYDEKELLRDGENELKKLLRRI